MCQLSPQGSWGCRVPQPLKKLSQSRRDVWVPTLTGEPIPRRLRRLTPVQANALHLQVLKWQDAGVIEPCLHKPDPNNLVFVAKKNGAIRVCVDCTPANEVTQDFDWPLPALQDLRHEIRGSHYFARLDLKDAFFRISVPSEYRDLTSFHDPTINTTYRFRKMPFGLKTAPSVFQRFMDTHLAPLGFGYFWYIDDILVHAETRNALRRRVHALRKQLRTMGCEVNEGKSEYDTRGLLFAGIWITGDSVSANAAKTAEVLSLAAPTTKKEAQSALGLVSYLRDFIPLVSHFTSLLYPDKSGLRLPPDEYAKEWSRLRRHLASAISSLRHWRPNIPAQLFTDASGTGIGVILIQGGQVVSLASRQMTPAETRYSATDREHIALVFAAKKFRMFLHQPAGATQVRCDHAALINRRDEDLTPKQARWKAIVKYWMPHVTHVKGLDNPADFISRWQVEIGGGVLKT
ncbi:MAG: hypothetical protein EOO38_08450 [Cytophagaceae bacterium]|nr:MAG: hypothetical protein EOO38_08450 [Cytophagaceae bacterium]